MERKTKEQLIIDQINIESLRRGDDPVTELTLREAGGYDVLIPPITLAMQTYADQEMVLFAEWIAKHCSTTVSATYPFRHQGGSLLTTHQLIDKYKESIK